MRPVLTPSEATALDTAADARGISVEWLMENAGAALARSALAETGGAYGRRAVVVCGKGNNGGDGAVAGRYLDGVGVRVSLVWVDEPRGLATQMRMRLREETTAREVPLASLGRELERADVVIDAIFGTGFRGVAEGAAATAIGEINAARALRGGALRVIAADIASGVDGATGLVAGAVVRADTTVAFGSVKVGNVLYPGAEFAGAVDVVDIGFPETLIESPCAILTEAMDVAALLPHRVADGHKRRSGSVLVAAGSRSMPGAAALIAQAAYRAGAGLVTVATAESAIPAIAQHVAEAVFIALPETDQGDVRADGLKVLWERLGAFGSFAIGPGLGRSEDAAAFARDLAAAAPAPVVLDADGLNAFAGDAVALTDRGAVELVLTPHGGEFARLAARTVAQIDANRLEAVRGLALLTQATVLLKGSRTVIAGGSPGVSASASAGASAGAAAVQINPTGSAFLATAGSGDVLTGVIAALLAQGLTGMDAATAGAFVHGLAGAIAGEQLGDGTTASDIVASIPAGFAAVGRKRLGVWEADGP